MPNIVECPIDDCGQTFDVVRDASRINPACPHCGATWGECIEAANQDTEDGEAAQIEYPIDGPARVRQA